MFSVNPVANHFAAAGCGFGLALAVPFAQAEGLSVLPQRHYDERVVAPQTRSDSEN